jgi:hypothetical protein
VTGDTAGYVFASTDGFNTVWAQRLSTSAIQGISCPASNLCAAVDFSGNFYISRSPLTTSPNWTWSGKADPYTYPTAISCASASLCLIGDNGGNAFVSQNPTASSPSWNVANVDNAIAIASASCPTTTFCAMVDSWGGNFFTSTNPAANTWARQHLFNSGGGLSVDCSSATFCAVANADGTVLLSTNPTSFASWSFDLLNPSVPLVGVSCVQLPSVLFGGQATDWCAAIDQNNEVLTAPGALEGPSSWSSALLSNSARLTSVSCTFYRSGFLRIPTPWCLITASDGTYFYSSNPGGGASAWTHPSTPLSANGLVSSWCPATNTCLALDQAGNTYETSNGASSWISIGALGANGSGLTCSPGGGSNATCFAWDTAGDVFEQQLGSPNPGWVQITSASQWLSGISFTSLSCPTSSQCLFAATSSAGQWIMQLTNGQLGSQSLFQSAFPAIHVSCPSNTACFAADGMGQILYSANPFGSPPSYSTAQLDGAAEPLAISCDSTSFCAVADTDSSLLLGTTLPVVTSVVASEGPVSGSQSVVISGINLSSPTAVDFGASTAATGFHGQSATAILAVTPPASSTGSVDVFVSTAAGTSPPRSSDKYTYVSGLPYFAVTPTRICDTRTGATPNPCNGSGSGTLGPGGTLNLQVAGKNGVPSNAAAVVLNVTVTDTTAWSYLTIWPTGSTRPTTSNLNWQAGRTVANLTVPTLSGSGAISFYNAAGQADVIVDLQGYFAPYPSSGSGAGAYVPFGPSRLLDTRPGSGYFGSGSTLGPGGTISFSMIGFAVYPSAVVLNVTATNTTASGGYLTVWPTGQSQPLASDLNWSAGQTVANRVIVPLGSNMSFSIYNAVGSADVIVDISGYFTDNSQSVGTVTGSFYNATAPARICDTRSGATSNQCNQAPNGTLGPSSMLKVSDVSMNLPASAAALMTNITATDTTAWGYLATAPDGAPAPASSDVNWTGAGQTVPNAVVPGLSSGGAFDIYNALGSVDVIVDVEGYFQ